MYPIDMLWALGRERDRERLEAADRRRRAAAATAAYLDQALPRLAEQPVIWLTTSDEIAEHHETMEQQA